MAGLGQSEATLGLNVGLLGGVADATVVTEVTTVGYVIHAGFLDIYKHVVAQIAAVKVNGELGNGAAYPCVQCRVAGTYCDSALVLEVHATGILFLVGEISQHLRVLGYVIRHP